jgi:hypothetical protein
MIKNDNGEVYISPEYDVNVLLEVGEILEEYVKQYPDTVHRAVLASMCEMICKKGYFVQNVDRYKKNKIIEDGLELGEKSQTIADGIIEELKKELAKHGGN